ncbi:MAG: DNA polymerase I [Planctomycetaceae bacterium]
MLVGVTPPPGSAADPDLTGRTVWVIDTLSRVYQLFHALPEMSSPQGVPVSAVFGFARDLLETVPGRGPDYLFCALDAPGPTFRHQRDATYKATRAEMPADLVPQIPLVRRLLETCGIPCLELAGYEADDILATIAERTLAHGGRCILATSGKDARQLLGPDVQLFNLRTGGFVGTAELEREWGIRPDQVVDYLSLVGDSADNVAGVPGIGPKTASDLLRQHGTLDRLLDHVDQVAGTKRRENLTKHADTARHAREMVRLDRAVPIDIPWEAGRRHTPDPERVGTLLRELGFRSLVTKVRAGPPSAVANAAPITAPRPAERQASLLPDDDGPAIPFAAHAAPVGLQPPAGQVLMPTDEASLAAAIERLPPGRVAVVVVTSPSAHPIDAPAALLIQAHDDGAGAAPTAVWVPAELARSEGPVARCLTADGRTVVVHDVKRLLLALRALGMPAPRCVFDTLLAACLVEAGQRNLTLSEVATARGASPPGPAVDAPSDPASAATAARLVNRLADRLPSELATAGQTRLYEEVELPLATVLAAMEAHGIRVDPAILARLAVDFRAKLASLEAEIHSLAGRAFAIASPVQVRAILFDELGLPVVKRTKTGASTDAEVLEELALLHPLPARLLEHRRYAKLQSTYVEALPGLVRPRTGLIHTTLHQTATATGRLSSSDPNLQNIPVRSAEGQQIRAAFLPATVGWRFVAADYSQIELRMLAHLSGDPAMRAAFAAGDDIHARTAAAVFGIGTDAVTPAMRRAAKAVNFGILYGQSAFGLAKALRIPQAEAAAFIAAYLKSFAGAAAFMDEILDRCRVDGRVTTILGRHRAISGVRERARRRTAAGAMSLTLPERTAVNTVVQGSAADLIKLAMLRVARGLERERLDAALVLQIHDELLLETPPRQLAAVATLVAEEMRTAMELTVPLVVTVHDGATWAECEKH